MHRPRFGGVLVDGIAAHIIPAAPAPMTSKSNSANKNDEAESGNPEIDAPP
jgi:hypothetical protein